MAPATMKSSKQSVRPAQTSSNLFGRLPNEMVMLVFSHLAAEYENKNDAGTLGDDHPASTEDEFPIDSEGPAWSIMAVRLTCSRFRDLSSHLLIRSVHLNMGQDSLDRLRRIASHEVFSQSVRAVRVSIHEHLPPAATSGRAHAIRWSNWIRYHIAELHRCIEISPGVDHHSANGRKPLAGVTQVADVVFTMLAQWDKSRAVRDGYPLENIALPDYVTSLEAQISKRCRQQNDIFKNPSKFATAIAKEMRKMPQAKMFEVGDFNPDVRAGASIQRFRRCFELLKRRIQPDEVDREMVFKTIIAPVLIRPLSRLERSIKVNFDGAFQELGSPVEGNDLSVLPLINVASNLPYMIADLCETVTHLSMRIEISHVNIDDYYDIHWRQRRDNSNTFKSPMSALKNIKTFSLVCDPGFDNHFKYDYQVTTGFRRLYSVYLRAPNIENVRLRLKEFGDALPKPTAPDLAYGGTALDITFEPENGAPMLLPWRNLRVLSINRLMIHYPYFTKLIKMFKRTRRPTRPRNMGGCAVLVAQRQTLQRTNLHLRAT
ncbi:hypothetical protein QBC39DRAFT_406373 [Podospora conica]|nr:hypothetical protein QBC39DRAFT_406373 [Schizothecium conicum]